MESLNTSCLEDGLNKFVMSCFVQTSLKLASPLADRATVVGRSSFLCDPSAARLHTPLTPGLRNRTVAVLNTSPPPTSSTQPESDSDASLAATSGQLAKNVDEETFLSTVEDATENGHATIASAIASQPNNSTTRTDESAGQPVTSSTQPKSLGKNGADWYSIEKPIAKPDTYQAFSVTAMRDHDSNSDNEAEPVLDVLQLEQAGRQVLERGSYDKVVDVNVDDGGVLEKDNDNNDLFTGVGMEALIDSEVLIENLRNELGIETATHVQLAAIPRVLERRDMVMQSYTGTGKTLAFLLPILEEFGLDQMRERARKTSSDDSSNGTTTAKKNMDDDYKEISFTRAVIVAPTRELAMQITHECERLLVGTRVKCMPLIGGANPARQVERLRRGPAPHIVVGTPGRLAELAESRNLRVQRVLTLVIDEVDHSVEANLGECVRKLLRIMPVNTQKVLVSATGDVDTVRAFAGELLHDPILLRVGGALRVPRNIAHWFCVVPARLKIETLRKLMFTDPQPERAIVFVDDQRRVDIVGERLWQFRIPVGTLRGNAHKTERKEVLEAFRRGRIRVLVSTEIAARGLDVKEISHVFNLDLPTDADHYVHRAGRCGRVGRPGTVVSIATGENAFVMPRLSREINVQIKRMEPRRGEYAEPLVRERRRNDDKGDDRKKKEKTPTAEPVVVAEQKMKKSAKRKGIIKEAGNVSKGIDRLQGALLENDVDYLKNTLGIEEDEDKDKANSGGKPAAGRKVNSSKAAKKKKAVKSKVRKVHNNDNDDDLNIQVGDGGDSSDPAQAEARLRSRINRDRRNLRKRAAMEGWVGNRATAGQPASETQDGDDE